MYQIAACLDEAVRFVDEEKSENAEQHDAPLTSSL